MKVVRVSISLICAIFVASCCCASSPALKFSEKDSGMVVNVKIGDELEVNLKSNPSTGYKWNVVGYDSQVIGMGNVVFTRDSSMNSDAVGVGGVETFKFNVTGPGESDLVLQYNRSWEKNVAPVAMFKLTIKATTCD